MAFKGVPITWSLPSSSRLLSGAAPETLAWTLTDRGTVRSRHPSEISVMGGTVHRDG